ncbi:hypothetical protein A1D31_35875 [Bradyrhizobium liaoningense]|nr:hypothetical protein A1D31_35875 [Bradyrhizobium liaoningense]
MTLWDNVWEQVRKEMPEATSRPRTWGGFVGAIVAAALVILIWFPVRLIAEVLKAISTDRKADHRPESEALFRDAYDRAAALPSSTAFAESVLRHVELSPALYDAFETAIRKLYTDNMMLTVPPIPVNLDGLDAIRWRDRLRQEIPRMNESSLVAMRRACLESVEAATVMLPQISGDGNLTAPIASLAPAGRFVEALIRPLASDHFPSFAARYEENVAALSGTPRAKGARSPKTAEPHMFDDPAPFLAGTPYVDILSVALPIAFPR